MNVIFKKITLQNFLSSGNVPLEINLETDLVTLIVGENRDTGEEGHSRNGVGKSTIFQALSYVLFDQGISDGIKKDGFVNLINKRNMLVTLDFTVDDVELKLVRGRKPNVLQLLKDGEPYTPARGNVEAIESIIGMNHDMFMNILMLTNDSASFHKLKPAGQKAFIENMINIHLLTERAASLKSANKENSVYIQLEEQKIESTKEHNTKISKSLQSLKSQSDLWVSERYHTVSKLERELATLEAFDADKEIALTRTRNQLIESLSKASNDIDRASNAVNQVANKKRTEELEIAKLQSELNNIDQQIRNVEWDKKSQLDQISQFETQVIQIDKELSSLTREEQNTLLRIESYKSNIEELNEQIKRLEDGECPTCSAPYTDEGQIRSVMQKLLDIEQTIDEEYNSIELLKQERNELLQTQSDIPNQIESIRSSLSTYEDKIADIEATKVPINQQIVSVQANIDDINRNLDDLAKDLEPLLDNEQKIQKELEMFDATNPTLMCEDEIDQIKSKMSEVKAKLTLTQNNNNNPYTKQIEELENCIEAVDESKLNELLTLEQHYKVLIKLLTDSKSFIRKSIIDQYIPFINQKTAQYLEALQSPHLVKINNDLTVDINTMGMDISYGNLSRGERLRVDLATSLAFREFIGTSGVTTNLLCVDELLDSGIDSSGMYAAWKVLKDIKGSVFIISHRDELMTEVDNMITVIKERGFTKLVA